MSAEQLTALDGLRTGPDGGIPDPDGATYDVRIIDADGSVAAYRAAVGNATDDPAHALDIATLEPFLETFECTRGTISRERGVDTPTVPSAQAIAAAVALPTDLGCINGLHVPQGCSDSFFTFDVTTPATYLVTGGPCVENLFLRVYSADATALIAESTPGTADACYTLSHAFDAGTYVFAVGKTNAAGCSVKGVSGDTTIRISRAP